MSETRKGSEIVDERPLCGGLGYRLTYAMNPPEYMPTRKEICPLCIGSGKGKPHILESERKAREEKQDKLNVIKVENTPNYGAIYTVSLPVRFYFNKDGGYDGIEFATEGATENELSLIKELLEKLDLKPIGKREN